MALFTCKHLSKSEHVHRSCFECPFKVFTGWSRKPVACSNIQEYAVAYVSPSARLCPVIRDYGYVGFHMHEHRVEILDSQEIFLTLIPNVVYSLLYSQATITL